jgi:hypothetical protein
MLKANASATTNFPILVLKMFFILVKFPFDTDISKLEASEDEIVLALITKKLSRSAGGRSPHTVYRSRRSVVTAPALAPDLVPHLLKLLPLLGSEDFLQAFISLLTNLDHSRIRLLPQSLQLLARLSKYLLHLGLLIGVELQAINQLLVRLPARLTARSPSLIAVQCQGPARESQNEDKYRRDANLPFAFASLVHNYFTTSSSVS